MYQYAFQKTASMYLNGEQISRIEDEAAMLFGDLPLPPEGVKQASVPDFTPATNPTRMALPGAGISGKDIAKGAVVSALVSTGVTLGANMMAAGIDMARDKLTYNRDLNKILSVDPDIKNKYSKRDIDLAYRSLRTLSPVQAKDPLMGSGALRSVLGTRDPLDPTGNPRIDLATQKAFAETADKLNAHGRDLRNALVNAGMQGVSTGEKLMLLDRQQKHDARMDEITLNREHREGEKHLWARDAEGRDKQKMHLENLKNQREEDRAKHERDVLRPMDTTNHNEMKDPAAVQSRAAVRDMNKTKADEFNHNNAKTLRANQLKVDAAKAEDFLHPDAAATRERQRTTGLHTADHALMGARATTDRIHHALSALDDAAAKERMSASDYARRYMQASGAHTLEHMQDAILDPEKAPEQAALEAARHAILYRVGNP